MTSSPPRKRLANFFCQESGSEIGFYNRASTLEKMFVDDSILFKSKAQNRALVRDFASNKSAIQRSREGPIIAPRFLKSLPIRDRLNARVLSISFEAKSKSRSGASRRTRAVAGR